MTRPSFKTIPCAFDDCRAPVRVDENTARAICPDCVSIRGRCHLPRDVQPELPKILPVE